MEIPVPQSIQNENDIFNYGFDKSLNRNSDVSLNPDFSNSETQNEAYNALSLAGINVQGSQEGNFYAGFQAGYNMTPQSGGLNNTLIGYQSGKNNKTGSFNSFLGNKSGFSNTLGNLNIFLGDSSGYSNESGDSNIFIGQGAGYYNKSGDFNTFLGSFAGFDKNNTTSYGVYLGNNAGYHETGSYKLFIDSIARANEADGRSKSLIYGVFDDAVANQEFHINAGHIYLNGTEYTPVTNTISMTAGQAIAIRDAVYVCGGNEESEVKNVVGNTDFNINDSTWYLGQTFTTSAVAGRLLNVKIWLQDGTGNCDGNFTVSIRATSADKPTGADLASVVTDATTISGTITEYTFTFATPLTVTPSTKYAILINYPNAAAGKYLVTKNSQGTGDEYAGGDWTLGNGTDFTNYNYDMVFKATETPTVGRIYKASSGTATGDGRYNNFLGFATAAINAGSAGNIQYSGILGGFTGLTIGQYYLASTAGTIQTTPGTNSKKVALAKSTTEILIKQT